MSSGTPTVVTFIIYIALMILVGVLGYRATRNLSDYILGGRRLGSFVTALSAGASDMSGWLLMGLPGAVFLHGISETWIAIGLIIGAWFNWKFVAARLRVYTEKCGNAQTLPDYLANRFEDKSSALRIITAIVILVFFTLYCASGVVAGARLFENMFGFSYEKALIIGALATITYVFIGGFLAVSWTDTIQASFMITALILVPLMVISEGGGWSQSIAIIGNGDPKYLDMFLNLDVIAIISLMAWGLGYFGQPHILVRFMAAKSAETVNKARKIAMTWMILCLAGACAVGFFGIAFYAQNPELAGALTGANGNAEAVFMELARQLFNPWMTGFLLASILAAIMSTLSCQLLVCSSALTEDIYKTFVKKNASQQELVWVGRMMVLLVALLAIYLALDPASQVLKMVSYAWAGFGAAFGPAILLSLTWQRMTKNGALAGIIVGAATVLIWKQFAWFNLYEIVPGFIFATIAIFLVSILGKEPSARIAQIFKEMCAELEINKT